MKSKKSHGLSRRPTKKSLKNCTPQVPSPRAFPSSASTATPSIASHAEPPQAAYALGLDEPAITVPVAGRRKEIARYPGEKIKPPHIYGAKQLAGRVTSIRPSLEHGSTPYFRTEALYLAVQTGREYDYVCHLGGDVLRLTRNLLGESVLKVLATFPDWLLKTYGPRHATSTERAANNLMAHLDLEIVPFRRIKQKARKDMANAPNSSRPPTRTFSRPVKFGCVFFAPSMDSMTSKSAESSSRDEIRPPSSLPGCRTHVQSTT